MFSYQNYLRIKYKKLSVYHINGKNIYIGRHFLYRVLYRGNSLGHILGSIVLPVHFSYECESKYIYTHYIRSMFKFIE